MIQSAYVSGEKITVTREAMYVDHKIVTRSRDTTVNSECVVVSHVTVNYIKILSVAQQRFYGKCISPSTMPIVRIIFLN
jgi:hypothetical protein